MDDLYLSIKLRATKDADIIEGFTRILNEAQAINPDIDRSTLIRKALRQFISSHNNNNGIKIRI